MKNNIELQIGKYGAKAIIKTSWDETFLKFLQDHDVQELELNDGKGWQGENVDFLKFLPNLKSLTLIDLKIKSINSIHYLNELLEIQLSTYSDSPIDFNSFPKLIECGFEWIKGSDSLFDSIGIRKLFLNSYNNKSSDLFSKLVNLEELSILNSPIEDIKGLFSLKHLKSLRLANLKKITSLQGIQSMQQLEELKIQRCKGINIVSDIFQLPKLKRLLLLDIGNIESIRGIENLIELKDFIFYESTNVIDGDITPVLKLKHLEKISYQNRKHYSNKREDFGKLYFQ